MFGATEALDKGLVTRVLPDDEVEAAAFASARRIASGAPLVNRWHKQFINRVHASGAKLGGGFTAEEQAEGFACFGTADYRVSHTISCLTLLGAQSVRRHPCPYLAAHVQTTAGGVPSISRKTKTAILCSMN